MLIDNTYFVQDLQLDSTNYSTINAAISKYEVELLENVLGYELAKIVIAYNVDTSEQRIKDIVEGKEYSINYNDRTQTIKWKGLANDELISPIAYYTYYKYQVNNKTINTGNGEILPKSENADNSNFNSKILAAYNNARNTIGFYNQNELIGSLYNFLMENESDYPELIFSSLTDVTAYQL